MMRTYQRAVRILGAKDRIKKAIEELTELSLSLQHYPNKTTLKQVVGEIADTEGMLTQIKIVLNEETDMDIEEMIREARAEDLELLNKAIKHKTDKRRNR